MRTCSRLLLVTLFALCLPLAVPLLAADEPASSEPAASGLRPLKDLTPDSLGTVRGRVYDAETGMPIENARVTVQNKGAFAESGETTARTGPTGEYKCRGKIGRYRSEISGTRVLMGGLAGLLSGSARKISKKVDVAVMKLRATAPGYKPFEGVVACKDIDAAGFGVAMEPILLVKEDAPGASTAAAGWGAVRVLGVEVNPPVARPGSKVTVTAHLRTPRSREHSEIRIACAGEKVAMRTMKPVDPKAQGLVDYTATVELPKQPSPLVERLVVWVSKCPYDLGYQMTGSAIIQSATTPQELEAAELRQQAQEQQRAGNGPQAQQLLRAVMEGGQATPFDCRWLARLSEDLHDYDTMVAAWEKLMELTPPKERLREAGGYAQGLLAAGQPARALAQVMPLLEGVKKQDYPKKISPQLALALVGCYLREGQLDKADEWHQQLMSWKGAANLPGLAQLRGELRLAKARAAMEKAPQAARAVLDYGRVLMDLGRWDEAVAELTRVLQLDPSLGAARWDLAYAQSQLRGESGIVSEGLEAALAEAEAEVAGTGDKKSKDFFAYHRLGMLLYRKSRQQQEAGQAEAAQTLARCCDTLYEGLKLARSSTVQENYGFWGYSGPQVNMIAGWSYPEAALDFTFMDSLHAVSTNPNDYLAHYGLARALVELGQWDLARDALARVQALQPDFTEAKFAAATIAMRLGDSAAAIRHFNELVQANPRHPQANLTLARLYTEEGDPAAAAACLARHAACYGSQEQ